MAILNQPDMNPGHRKEDQPTVESNDAQKFNKDKVSRATGEVNSSYLLKAVNCPCCGACIYLGFWVNEGPLSEEFNDWKCLNLLKYIDKHEDGTSRRCDSWAAAKHWREMDASWRDRFLVWCCSDCCPRCGGRSSSRFGAKGVIEMKVEYCIRCDPRRSELDKFRRTSKQPWWGRLVSWWQTLIAAIQEARRGRR